MAVVAMKAPKEINVDRDLLVLRPSICASGGYLSPS